MSAHSRRAFARLRRTAATDSAISQLRTDIASHNNILDDGPPSPLTARALVILDRRRSDPIEITQEWTLNVDQDDLEDAVADITPFEGDEVGTGADNWDRPPPKRTSEQEQAIDDLLEHLQYDKTYPLACLTTINRLSKEYRDHLQTFAMSILSGIDLHHFFEVRRSITLIVNGCNKGIPRLQWTPLSWLSLLVDQYFEQKEGIIVLRAFAGFYGRIGHPEEIKPVHIVGDLLAQLLSHERCVVNVKTGLEPEKCSFENFKFLLHQLRKSVLQQLQHTPILVVFDEIHRVYEYRQIDRLVSEIVLCMATDCRYPLRILVVNWTSFDAVSIGIQRSVKVVDVERRALEDFDAAVEAARDQGDSEQCSVKE